ncbi:MAG: M20 family metallopeptidase [Proteobacteria bacterium]|nr:M20 family metallopeptidase [Pseudomonadota bacterium]
MTATFENNLFEQISSEIAYTWKHDIIPRLSEYIKIPNKSPYFDRDWKANGHMDKAMDLIVKWCTKQPIAKMSITVLEEENRTPLLFIEIEGQIDETILLYGHMDKQPEMRGWHSDLGPWNPVLKEGRLYGRGSADDGYSVFTALTAIAALQRHHIPHARCVVLIEASEESGSPDLPFYLQKLQNDLDQPSLIICLDSGCGNYEQLWSTTSLRGLISGTLRIEVLTKGMHSGVGSGVVPSAFRILELLLDRIEDRRTGEVLLDELKVKIPAQYQQQAKVTAEILGEQLQKDYPFAHPTQPVSLDDAELIINRTWRPALSIIGLEGLPNLAQAGNVTIPNLGVEVSIRIPPGCDPEKASAVLKHTLEQNPPYSAKVSFTCGKCSVGWQAPLLADWLAQANDQASNLFFGKPAAYLGEGGTIPFMGMLGKMFPEAQFLITGVLGPDSSAHGPNEFLDIDMAQRLTGCVASVIAAHGQRR